MKTRIEKVYQGYRAWSKRDETISAFYNGYPFFLLNTGGGNGVQVYINDIDDIIDVLRRVQKEQPKLEQLNLEDSIDKEFGE